MTFSRTLLLVLALSSVYVSAQEITGSIRGMVTDPTGAVVQGATITARQSETGLTHSTTTDHGGNYILVELPVGHYRLEVAAKNFQKYVQEGISLNVNETAIVAARLGVGSDFCGLVRPARLKMLPNVLAAGHATSGCSISSLALSFRAPQDGCLARSTRMLFSIGSSVACEQLCGRLLRSTSPSRPVSL